VHLIGSTGFTTGGGLGLAVLISLFCSLSFKTFMVSFFSGMGTGRGFDSSVLAFSLNNKN
jgi:hypothetical protein